MAVYQETPPCPELAPFVHAFWRISASDPAADPIPVRVVPDGCVDLLLGPDRVSVVGAMTAPKVVWASGRSRALAVRFRPGGAHPFLRVPLHELTDRSLPLDEIWRASDEALAGGDGVAALQSLLLARVPDHRRDAVDHALSTIARTGGRITIRDLRCELALSERHLERLFRERVGVSPKALCRITRFQHAVRALQSPREVDWQDLVHAGRFSDQAHFIREFRTLSGLTPCAYRREQRRVGFVQYSTASAA